MTKANECTCPSGDGSLAHPCPAHPAVEQAGGDERAAQWHECTCPKIGEKWNPAKHGKDCPVHQARASLAQPSPAPELERPEVAEVAFVLRNIGAMDAEDIDGDNVDLRFEDAEGRDTGCDVSIVEYAEKAADLFEQHDRIVGALRAENAKLSEALDRWPLIRDSLKLRLADALARVAELDKQCRDDVARALGLRPSHERGFAWSYLLASIKSCVKASEDAAQAQHSVPAYVSYTTRPAESLAGISLRQLKDESRWVEIRDINAHAFPDMQSHSYYPAGTVIKLPAAAPGKEGV
ncbi:TPA: hypothetical protein NQO12_000486 [Pseudomonas aeruginosa]|nr:hypothetical protein [Pseudomonas aeruginosa]